jgi:hypothetical protein
LQYTFVIVLEKEAKEPYLREFKQDESPILVELYDSETGDPINFYLDRNGKAVLNPEILKHLSHITNTLVQRTLDLSHHASKITQDPPSEPRSQSQAGQSIVIGAVTQDLEPIRDGLARKLRDNNYEIEIITFDDFKNDDQLFQEKASKGGTFVQLYSYAKLCFTLGDFQKLIYPSARSNQDVPFG